ncbi:MAG: hypothetical protein CVU97_06050 [Firmicutes bacterium HGW-Firmicutes-21]|nr:MAG: hypothetical protein CVU97_06050 [Firmicutes bacterium HGW-Firmicutes-21]
MSVERMKEIIGISFIPEKISYDIIETIDCGCYQRKLIHYTVNNRLIPAFLLIPKIDGNRPAVLINHQHNRERNLGKSEVCGLAGNPLQAFGVALVERGFVVIAPDSLCFEERRQNAKGIEKNDEQDDWNHFLALCHGILSGQYLAKTVIEDAMGAISVLNNLDNVERARIGCLGHSYGGNTTYFLTAFDNRIKYALSSGSVASYKYRIENQTGIEMASIIPNFLKEFEIVDVIKEISPRKFMIVCADDDKYSKDAPDVFESAKTKYIADGYSEHLQIKQFIGGHALTTERYDFIVNWISNIAK